MHRAAREAAMIPAPVTSEQDLESLAGAFQWSAALLAAVELGLFTALSRTDAAQGRTPQALAQALDADPRGVDRLLRALAVLGLVAEQGGSFANTDLAERHLVEGAPGFLGAMGHRADVYRSWGTLARAVRHGGAVQDRENGPQGTRNFIAAMHHRAAREARAVAQALDLAASGARRVLDVGGGSGAFAMEYCRAAPGLSAVVLDLPHVLELTRGYLAEADRTGNGMAGRVELRPGNYLDAEFGSGFDLVFFSSVMHINSPAQNQHLLRKAFGALDAGGRAAIRDFVLEEDRMAPPKTVFFALNMLASTPAGDSYTFSEYADWFAGAGFADVKRMDVKSMDMKSKDMDTSVALLTAVKP